MDIGLHLYRLARQLCSALLPVVDLDHLPSKTHSTVLASVNLSLSSGAESQ